VGGDLAGLGEDAGTDRAPDAERRQAPEPERAREVWAALAAALSDGERDRLA